MGGYVCKCATKDGCRFECEKKPGHPSETVEVGDTQIESRYEQVQKKEEEVSPKHEVYLPTAENLSSRINQDFNTIFNEIDRVKDGKLEGPEIEKLLNDLTEVEGLVISASSRKELLKKADCDGDGKISKDEFRDWIRDECLSKRANLLRLLEKRPWLQEVTKRAFKSVDNDGNGSLDIEELVVFLAEVSKEMGEEPFSRQRVQKALELADDDNDGRLTEEEFRTLLKPLLAKLFLHADPNSAVLD